MRKYLFGICLLPVLSKTNDQTICVVILFSLFVVRHNADVDGKYTYTIRGGKLDKAISFIQAFLFAMVMKDFSTDCWLDFPVAVSVYGYNNLCGQILFPSSISSNSHKVIFE